MDAYHNFKDEQTAKNSKRKSNIRYFKVNEEELTEIETND